MEWWTPCDEDLSKGISWAELREVLRLRGSRSLSTESTNPCAARCWSPWGISAPSRPMLRPSSFREQNVKQNGNFCGVPLWTHSFDWWFHNVSYIFPMLYPRAGMNDDPNWLSRSFTDFWDGWLNTSQFLSRHLRPSLLDLAARSNPRLVSLHVVQNV